MKKIRELMEKLKVMKQNAAQMQSAAANGNTAAMDIQKRIRMQILILVASMLLVVVLIFAMTAAWFTNVAKTSDLVFQTESWGFDEENITIGNTDSESAISIAPGTSGIIPLTVDNSESADSVQIGVAISKEGMEPDGIDVPELQKRIFFYVDTPKTYSYTNALGETTSEETVSRVYLGVSSPETYTYTILPGQKLTMNDIYYNDVPIKWEWVYDMLGYYFRGTVTDTVAVDEYIRPIEYDYDTAVFDETSGELTKIGETSTADFLADLSGKDGYEGNIKADVDGADDVVKAGGKLYYKVDVDDSGYGVWAYLCSFDEIEAGFTFDTGLSEKAPITAKATIMLTANSVPAKVETVTTEAALNDALLDESVDTVELGMDVSVGTPISFTEGSKIINLNGYTLGYDGVETEYELVSVKDGASLTVTNGMVSGNTSSTGAAAIKTKAFDTAGGNLVLSNVDVTGVDTAVYVEDMNAANDTEEEGTAEGVTDSTIQITNCNFDTAQVSLVLQGNGAASDAMTKVIVQDSTLNSQYYVAISGQGNDDRWGTELVLINSTVTGYYGAIYQPQKKSITTISGCTITGNTGIAIKGGTLNIYDSVITGTGAVSTTEAAAARSGFTDTGDGVYMEAVYDWSTTVTLRGENEISSETAFAVELFGEDGKGPGKILIYGGTYSGAKGSANWNDIGNFEIYGGTYEDDVNDTITRYDVTATDSE